MESVKSVTLYAETLQAASVTTANNRTNPIDCTGYVEGNFVFQVSQAGTNVDETIDVVIETYNLYTETWHTIGTFTQVTDATTETQQLLTIPYGLGSRISCSWTIANMDTGKEYTISISGILKS